MNPTRFEPVYGKEYVNRSGGTYRCGSSWENPNTIEDSWNASMVNTKTGWSITAHGLWLYPDGTIEWDYSTGGRFVEVVQ